MLLPILLLALLTAAVASARAMRKKGTMTESTYSKVISGVSVVVTVAAITVLIMRLQR